MSQYRVNQYAKSTYRRKIGTACAYSKGSDTWKIGRKYATHVCLVFKTGMFAGRKMWFSMGEIDI